MLQILSNHRVQVFNESDRSYVATIGTGVSGVGTDETPQFDEPRDIAISGGKLYVADQGNHRVQVFNINESTHVYEATIGTGSSGSGDGELDRPVGIAISGGKIYVIDNGNDRVQVFSESTRAYEAKFGSFGADDGEFNVQTA